MVTGVCRMQAASAGATHPGADGTIQDFIQRGASGGEAQFLRGLGRSGRRPCQLEREPELARVGETTFLAVAFCRPNDERSCHDDVTQMWRRARLL
jgi:hypothetical protein